MANQTQTQALDSRTQSSDEEESELEKLEADVNQMSQKVLEYRETLPDQLKNTLASILAAQRPAILTHFDDGSEPGPSLDPFQEIGRPADSGHEAALAVEDQENGEKIQLLKHKIASNASAMPIVLKRMKECMSKIDKLESCNGIIHPAFKRKRTS